MEETYAPLTLPPLLALQDSWIFHSYLDFFFKTTVAYPDEQKWYVTKDKQLEQVRQLAQLV